MTDIIKEFIKFCWSYYCDHRDSRIIYKFLTESKLNGKYTFRSTESISSSTGIYEERVAKLCSENKMIRRNEKEKQSWRII